jgi:ribose transport system permease protein
MAGTMCGAVSGYLVAARRMAPFIATLAMMTIARGFAFIISKGSPIIIADPRLNHFGSAYWLGVPAPVFVMIVIFGLVAFLLKYTVFGRMVTAIGSNEPAVRLAGVRTGWYKFGVYCISGAFCAVAGIISTSRTGVGSPIVGAGIELDAIAAVVVGGASLSGGKGTAFNTLLGVLILGTIGNIMNLMNIPGYPQQVIKGAIIICAVLLQGYRKPEP